MKRDTKTNVLAAPEFYSAFAAIFAGVTMGAFVARWFNNDLAYYVGMIGYFAFTLLGWKKRGNTDIKAKREEHLDALRWRALQENREFPIIEDVKQLRDTGRKIEAIKLYRQFHPEADLRTALDAVDLM